MGEGASPTGRLGHLPFLDGIRGIGVLSVMVFHTELAVFRGGYLALDVFFVLSGFLITSLLVREWEETGSVHLGRFFARRALRLLPALLAFLGFSSLYAWLALPEAVAATIHHDALIALLYLSNFGWGLSWLQSNLVTHTWSLSIEEQFYVLWPLTLLCLLRWRCPRWAVLGGTAAAVVALGLVRSSVDFDLRQTARLWTAVWLEWRGDSLLTGCLAGLAVAWGRVPAGPRARRVLAGAATLALAWLLFLTRRGMHVPAYYHWGLVTVNLASAVLIVGLTLAPGALTRRALEWRPLVWIGERSYGLYLWHLPLFWTLPGIGASPWPARWPEAAGRLLLAVAVATASYAWIETPFLRLKRRLGAPLPGAERGTAALAAPSAA
jgi:peptidoglycan/LPS O-acetylase OafA/YrhL